MDFEELNYLQEQKAQETNMRIAEQRNQLEQVNQAYALEDREKNMIREQLDIEKELEKIENLLRGNLLRKDELGNDKWYPPEDPQMVILSNYGIHLIMNTIAFYINKNTLLSNYDESTINVKMEDFATDLADTIFMEYEKVFQYPTFNDCKQILVKRLEMKKELRKFALELTGGVIDEKIIESSLIQEIEGRIDGEIKKIKEQVIKDKLKRFLILLREIQDAVHSTYLRAWKGQERITLRQHIHVSESIGGGMMQQNRGTTLNPLSWLKYRK